MENSTATKKTLQQVIDEIGGNSEMLGTTSLAIECLAESAELIATRGGYAIYELECGDYWLSHDCGSTHLVTSDDLDNLDTVEARVVSAATECFPGVLEVIFDNGGGVKIQAGGFIHHYDDPKQAAHDVRAILDGDNAAQWDGDEPDAYEEHDAETERNGGYDWYCHADVLAAIASSDLISASGHAEREFLVALTGRAVED